MKKFATALTSASLLVLGSASVAHADTPSDETPASQGVIITTLCDGMDDAGDLVGIEALASGSAMCDPDLPAPRDRSGNRVFAPYIPEWVLEIPVVEEIVDDILDEDTTGSEDDGGETGSDDGDAGSDDGDNGSDDGDDTVEP